MWFSLFWVFRTIRYFSDAKTSNGLRMSVVFAEVESKKNDQIWSDGFGFGHLGKMLVNYKKFQGSRTKILFSRASTRIFFFLTRRQFILKPFFDTFLCLKIWKSANHNESDFWQKKNPILGYPKVGKSGENFFFFCSKSF